MSYQVLARKWRPRSFDQIVGQSHAVQALTNGLNEGRVHHAFMFSGTRGVGKTTLARILAKALNCMEGVSAEPCGVCEHCVAIDEGRFVDLLEIDAASRTKVDDTREILDNVQYAPARGRFKVYLIDEVHMLSTHSFNALLKTLEEPPEHVKFVLATTDPQKVPVTILSRCLQFNLRRLQVGEIGGQLGNILKQEDVEFDSAAVELLARAADGSMRDGLSLMDQALASGGARLKTGAVEDMLGTVERRHLHRIIEALAERRPAAALEAVGDVFELARDLGQLLLELAETLHRISLIQQVPDYRDESRDDWDQLVDYAGRLDPEDVQLYYQIAVTGRRDLPLAPSVRTGCEMTLLRMLAFQPAGTSNASTASGDAARQAGDAAGASASSPAADSVAGSSVAEPPPAKVAEAAPAAAGRNLAALRPGDWPEVLNTLDLNSSVRAVAGLLALEAVEASRRLVFRCPEDDKPMVTKRFKESFKRALHAWFGVEVLVDIRFGTVEGMATPAQMDLAARDRALKDAEAAIDADPLVGRLRDTFSAEVIEGSVRPADRNDH